MRDIFTDECVVECTDNGKSITADVADFRQGVYLTVIMNTVKVSMQYESKFNQYVGNMGGLEFISEGPKKLS